MSASAAHPVSRRAVLGGLGAAAALAVVGCSGRDDDEGDGPEAEPGSTEVLAYGDESPLQVGALTLPADAPTAEDLEGSAFEGLPVVVLVHGGFWRPGYDRSLMDPLAASVAAQGWAAWNIDYRPIGEGGGWPTTFSDVASAVDHLDTIADDLILDRDRVAVVGHSAGGTLALWSGARSGLPAGVPGADPAVRPVAVVSQAGVANLAAAAIEGLGQGAAADLMGGQPTGEAGEAYLYASPIERLPLGSAVHQLLVHGTDDAIVPLVQSETYAARAADAGDEVRLEAVDGGDHFVVIDPDGPAWPPVLELLADRLA